MVERTGLLRFPYHKGIFDKSLFREVDFRTTHRTDQAIVGQVLFQATRGKKKLHLQIELLEQLSIRKLSRNFANFPGNSRAFFLDHL